VNLTEPKLNFKYILRINIGIVFVVVVNTTSVLASSVTARPEHRALSLQRLIDLSLSSTRNTQNELYSLQSVRNNRISEQSDFDIKYAPVLSKNLNDNGETAASYGLEVSKLLEHGPKVAIETKTVDSDDAYTSGVSLSISSPILKNIGRKSVLDNIHAADYEIRNSNRQLYLKQVEVVMSCIRLAYDFLKQQKLISLYTKTIESLEHQAKTSSAKEKVGLATPLDVYRAKIASKDIEQKLINSREALQAATSDLKYLIKLESETPLILDIELVEPSFDITLERAVKTAIENSIRVKGALDDISRAKSKTFLAKEDKLPDVDISLKYTYQGEDESFGRSTNLDDSLWSINISSSGDAYRKRQRIAYETALINENELMFQLERTKSEIRREIKLKMNLLKTAKKRIDISDKQVEQAATNFSVSNLKHLYTLATSFDVIEAEKELQSARENALNATVIYIISYYQFRRELGTLLESNTIE